MKSDELPELGSAKHRNTNVFVFVQISARKKT